jgi:hypothetical protein
VPVAPIFYGFIWPLTAVALVGSVAASAAEICMTQAVCLGRHEFLHCVLHQLPQRIATMLLYELANRRLLQQSTFHHHVLQN